MSARALRERLITFALGLPGAWEDHPWGERVAKVGKKVFVFFGTDQKDQAGFGLSVKLPHSGHVALMLPNVEPTGYGLGKSGWVSARFDPKSLPPEDMLREWIEESYKAIAPKKLAASVSADKAPPPKPAPKRAPPRKPSPPKPPAKKYKRNNTKD